MVANTIGCTNPIKEKFIKGSNPLYTVHFQNPIVKEIFKDYGIVHRKTQILQFPKLPEEYLLYYIRGVFEGDGSISIGTTKRGYVEQSKLHLLTSIYS